MPTLKIGAKGESVEVLQTKLNKLGYNLLVDGEFGTRTENAVKTFQKDAKIVVDGVVGPQTWGALG
jgi:peptidoglycan hydrolase-like protein with peptidoglycan-binding domain